MLMVFLISFYNHGYLKESLQEIKIKGKCAVYYILFQEFCHTYAPTYNFIGEYCFVSKSFKLNQKLRKMLIIVEKTYLFSVKRQRLEKKKTPSN